MTVHALHGPDGARAAGTVLGRAFVEDPLWAWLLRGGSRERRLTTTFTAISGTASRTPGAQLLVTAERTAAAVWLPPGAWRQPLHEQARTAPVLGRALRPGGVLRGLRVQAVVARLHPAEPHWYLEALGAVPQARGTGVARSVLQPVLDRCDTDGVLAYLESSNPRNWTFYERLGFVGADPAPMPAGCPVVLPMRRDPR